jgi:hypothetical protein
MNQFPATNQDPSPHRPHDRIYPNAGPLAAYLILKAPKPQAAASKRRGLAATVAAGSIVALLSIVADWAVVRAIYGDRFAGHAGFHIRFGPRATISRPENR